MKGRDKRKLAKKRKETVPWKKPLTTEEIAKVAVKVQKLIGEPMYEKTKSMGYSAPLDPFQS